MDQSARRSAVAAFTDEAGETPLVDVAEHGAGIAWTIERVVALSERWETLAVVADPGGPAASLIPRLQEFGLPVLETTTREVAAACIAFYDAREQRHAAPPWLRAAEHQRGGRDEAITEPVLGLRPQEVDRRPEPADGRRLGPMGPAHTRADLAARARRAIRSRSTRMIGRFSRWLQRDDPKKEAILYAIDSGLSDAQACKQTGISMATLRAWMGLDRDFAKAVRIAHRRELGDVHLWMFSDLEDGEDPRAIPPPTTPAWQLGRKRVEAVGVNALEAYADRLSRKPPDEREVLRQRQEAIIASDCAPGWLQILAEWALAAIVALDCNGDSRVAMAEAVAASETDIEDLETAMENLARFMRFQNFAAPFETAPVPDLKRLVESLSDDERDVLLDACDWLMDDATAHRDVRELASSLAVALLEGRGGEVDEETVRDACLAALDHADAERARRPPRGTLEI